MKNPASLLLFALLLAATQGMGASPDTGDSPATVADESPADEADGGQPPGDAAGEMSAEEFEASLKYQTGDIVVGDGLATLRIGNGLRYLDAADAQRVLEDAWGNPDGGGSLGMILPAETSPLSEESWAVVITYVDDGYVSDDDADDIDYGDLLEQMQAATKEESDARVKEGIEKIALLGWAEQPSYDKATHKMYWAKELSFGDQGARTLNYNIRILGREGVLVLNAVGSMDQLALIKQNVPQVIKAVNFNPGHTYADYQPGKDKLAAYGLAALIAGGIAAKTGLIAKLIGLVIAFKKVVIGLVLALGALLTRIFRRNKS